VKIEHVRRSQRIVPSIYRNRGGQENPVPTKQVSRNKKKFPNERPILEL
jgi:hypothetical protein